MLPPDEKWISASSPRRCTSSASGWLRAPPLDPMSLRQHTLCVQ